MRASLLGTRDLGRGASRNDRRTHLPSWMTEGLDWEKEVDVPQGGLAMDPVTFQRLVNYLSTASHTGMGHAVQALTRDTDGINALAREAAYTQASDHVIGRNHMLFDLEGV